MWLVQLCCVIASFLVNMLFLKIKSGLFIIRLFFPTKGGVGLILLLPSLLPLLIDAGEACHGG
jgi:hypothetical protein